MATVFQNQQRSTAERSLGPGVVLMVAAVLISLLGILLNSDLTASFPHLYLLPWLISLAVVLAIPNLYLYYKGRWHLYDPLVFATCSYFFPAFVIGGFMLTAGWARPSYLSFIQDAEYNFPYTIVLIGLGFIGLAVGYFLPVGAAIGSKIGQRLPNKDYDPTHLIIPGLSLLTLGIFNSIIGFVVGVVGYQKSREIESYEGVVFLTTWFWLQGAFLLWFVVFKRDRFDFKSAAITILLISTSVIKALFSGNRGGLLQAFTIVIMAFLLSGRILSIRKTILATAILTICLMAGMIYGTTFRNLKGSESTTSFDQYTDNIFDTFDHVGRFDFNNGLELALMGLAERFDTLSSVAVVVSTYEQLEPYEESYGLDNNILKDISTFFVPRIIWNDKPVASEPRKYSDLYFNYGETSFAITPMGDLLRNFGPIGVPLGMLFLGIIIRFIYRSLIENQPRLAWKCALYLMLLLTISYEGFYGVLIPILFKVGVTAIVGLLIVELIARALGHRPTVRNS